MAGFFDKLIGSEAAPEDRDYKTRSELSSPEEQQAYQAGADTSVIPGLDYAKSLFRGLGREVSGADMGSQAGEQYKQEMEANRQRQAEAERLRQAYPEAYRGGQNVGSEDYPVEAMVLGVQPMTSSIMRGIAGGTKYSRPNVPYGEFSEVPPDAQVGASRAPARIGYEPKIEYQPGPEAYWQEGGRQAPRGPLPEVKIKNNSEGWHYWDRPNYDESIDYPRFEGATPFKNNAVPHSVMDLHQQRLADINAGLNPSLRMPARSFLGTKDMGTNLLRSEYTDPEIANAIALSRKNFQPGPFSRAYDRPDASGKFPGPTKGALEGSYAIGRLGEVTPVAKGSEEISSILQLPTEPKGWRAKLESWMPESEAPSVTAPPKVNQDSLAYDAKSPFARKIMGLGEDIDAQAAEAAKKETAAKYGVPSIYRPKDVMKLDGSVDEEPGSLNFGVRREGYQEPKRSYVLPKALDIAGRTGAAGSIPLAIALAADRNKQLGALPAWNPNIKSDVGPQTLANRYGVEPVPVVANTPKEKAPISPAAKTAPKSTPRSAPKVSHKTPHRAAPRAGTDNRSYWGDWRDSEPFASDPIGNFIDSLTGQTKTARRPAKAQAPRDLDLGSLFEFADGGMVRKHYEDGGAEDRIPILSDIGDAIGNVFKGGEEPVVAKDRAEPAPAERQQGLGGINDFFERWSTNPMSQLLFASGAATMASPYKSPWMATGQGLERGLQFMQAAQANQERLRTQEEARRERARQMRLMEGIDQPEAAPARRVAEAETEEPVAPKEKVAEAEPTQPVAPVTAETAPAEKKEAVAEKTEAAPEPVVAADNPIDALYSTHRKISRVMGSITDPSLRVALANKQRAIEFEINKMEARNKQEYGHSGIVGQDEYGRPIYGYASGPRIGQPFAKQPISPAGATGEKLHGEDFLETLPAQMQESVRAAAEGRIPVSSSVKNNKLRDAVTQYDPTFNDNRYKMRNEYSSQRGFGAGAQITAAATARAHALTALEAADKLNNTGIHSINYVKHAMMGLVNDPAAKEFGEAVNALNGEVEKYFKGGAPADRAIERASEKLNTANTPQESIAALYTLQKLMAGKSVQLEHNWKKTMGNRPVEEAVPDLEIWNPRAQIAAKVLENRYKEAFPDYKSEEEKYPTLESVEGKKSEPTNPKIKALMGQYPGYTEQQLKELYEKKKGSQ